MPTLHSLKTKMKALSGRRPAADPADVVRIYSMLEPLAGLIGCGFSDEKKDDDGEKPG